MREYNLIFNGISGRFSEDGKIRIIVISLEEDQTNLWDPDTFFNITGQILTRELVEDYYVEAESACCIETKFEIKRIPDIFRVKPDEKKHYC